jgi:hypothetical protein
MDMVHITYRSGMEANASISIHKKILEDSRIDSYRMFIVVGKFDGGEPGLVLVEGEPAGHDDGVIVD